MIIEKNELAVQKQIEYIKDKAGKVSELARSNKLAMFAHLSIASLIILSYIIEIFKEHEQCHMYCLCCFWVLFRLLLN